MSANSKIRAAIWKLGGGEAAQDKPDVFQGYITAVNELARTCSCTLITGPTDLQLTNVRLMTQVDDGLLLIPAIDSEVMVSYAPNYDSYVVMYSQIDKCYIVAGGFTFLLWSSGIELAGNNFGGIPMVAPLTAKVNAIEKLLNELIEIYNSHTHPYVNVSAPAVTSPTTQTENNNINPLTAQSDLENTVVQHGDGSGSNLEEE
jgi:hypothetical protein